MNGKDKCKILKQIRRDIAEKNDIKLTIAECTHKGDCAGTCPRCESEVSALENALANRRKQGRQVMLAGISAGIVAASCVSCGPLEEFGQKLFGIELLAGDIAVDTTVSKDRIIEDESTFDQPTIMGLIAQDETINKYELDGDINPITEDESYEASETEAPDVEK